MTYLRILAVAFAVLLAGCAVGPVDPKDRTFKKVGVISVAGRYMTQMNVGITVFGNESSDLDVSQWGIDQEFARVMAAALRERAGLEAVVVDTAGELPEFTKTASSNYGSTELDSRWERAEARFKEIAREKDVGALIVIAPTIAGDFLGNSNQHPRGLGIYTRTLGSSTRIAALHLVASATVISGATGKKIGSTYVATLSSTAASPGERSRSQPRVQLPTPLARTPLGEMTAEQKTELRNAVSRLPLKAAFETTVGELLPGPQQPVRYEKIDLTR